MLFNSLQFLIFFCIATAAYFALPHRARWPLLVVASCYFYMVLVPEYILILFVLIVVDYTAGLLLEKTEGKLRTAVLVASLLCNIGMLGVFKYFDFINSNLHALFDVLGLRYTAGNLGLVLPIGLSFHTFQSMSYTIEVYRKRYPAEHHLGLFALYVLFYPQMVAGPIERPYHLLRQLHDSQRFEYRRVADGLKLMVWGLLKKVVIADRLALFVNHVYDDPVHSSGLPLIIATYFFSFQIYCDFSGYSDIAIGAAKVMGLDLMQNFNRPYYAKSIGEFWRRWHISLSSWFRDYVYVPLGGNRTGRGRMFFNLFVVFLVSGLWHGANWTFVLWGALHGCYLIFSILTQDVRAAATRAFQLDRFPGLQKAIRVGVVFHLVTFSWILFRAKSIQEAWYIATHLFSPGTGQSLWFFGFDRTELLIALLSLGVLEAVHLSERRMSIVQRIAGTPAWSRWLVYGTVTMAILLFGKFISLDFIYFQF